MFDLINIFDVFLPQLLLYPNPTDPLNAEAGALNQKNIEKYNEKVKEYVKKYAMCGKPDGLFPQGKIEKGDAGEREEDQNKEGEDEANNSLSQTSDLGVECEDEEEKE